MRKMTRHVRKLENIGKISFHRNRICWEIPMFNTIPQDTSLIIYSPEFFIMGRYCHMYTEPHSCVVSEKVQNRLLIGVSQKYDVPGLNSAITEPQFNCQVGITGKHEEVSISCTSCNTINVCISPMDCPDLDKEKEIWIYEGNLHLFCVIEKIDDKAEAKMFSQTSTEKGK